MSVEGYLGIDHKGPSMSTSASLRIVMGLHLQMKVPQLPAPTKQSNLHKLKIVGNKIK